MQDKLSKLLLDNISAHVQADQDAVRKVIAAPADLLVGSIADQMDHK